jgi:hypothetical protein
MRRAVVAAAMGWLLWQGVAPVLPDAPTEGAAVIQRYDTEDTCLKAATTKRAIRNAIIHKGAPAHEVFTCAPAGAYPARSHFE